ncbi:hypothetical protein VIGAN_01334700, partial [Vigna angularis var. angularis]
FLFIIEKKKLIRDTNFFKVELIKFNYRKSHSLYYDEKSNPKQSRNALPIRRNNSQITNSIRIKKQLHQKSLIFQFQQTLISKIREQQEP